MMPVKEIRIDERDAHSELLVRVLELVPVGARLVCDPEHCVVVVHSWTVVGVLPPGEYWIDPRWLPMIAPLVRQFPQGLALLGELFFAHIGGGVRYGFRVKLLERTDGFSGLSVTPSAKGWVKLSVADPAELVRRLGRHMGDADGVYENAIQRVQAARKPALERATQSDKLDEVMDPAFRQRFAAELVASATRSVAEFGLRLVEVGIDEVTLAEKDVERLEHARAMRAGRS